jgi:NAD(P)-dependent dehydrogenase (short-subunit alcohol dehydrogenase family)
MIITQEGQQIAEALAKLTASVLVVARRIDGEMIGLDDVVRDLDQLKGRVEKTWGLTTKA